MMTRVVRRFDATQRGVLGYLAAHGREELDDLVNGDAVVHVPDVDGRRAAIVERHAGDRHVDLPVLGHHHHPPGGHHLWLASDGRRRRTHRILRSGVW